MKTLTRIEYTLKSAILLLTMLPFLYGCSSGSGGSGGVGNVSGSVLDLNYNAISNADAVIGDSVTKSLSNGIYSFTNIPSGTRTIKITAPTFTSAYRRISFSGGQSVTVDPVFLAPLDGKVTNIPIGGGTASNTDGSIKIKFLNGAFAVATDVVLTAVPKVSAPFNSPVGKQFISYIVYAKPEDTTLITSATLKIPNQTNVTTEEVIFYRFNPNSYAWESIGNGCASPETNTINIETTYLGWIAAIVPINPSPGTISGTVTNAYTLSPISAANVWTQNSYSTTNTSGYYKLENVPTGTVTVFASAAGYDSHTSSPLIVASLSDTPYSFTMIPKDTGNISGTVKNFSNLPIVGARVVEAGGSVAFTNTYGIYTLYNISTGTVSVFAYADNYTSSGEAVLVSGGSTATRNFSLPWTGSINTYDFTFETGSEEFTTSGQWHRQYSNPVESLRVQNYFMIPHGSMPQKVSLPDTGYIPGTRTGGVGGNNYYMWYGKDKASPTTAEGSYIGFQEYSDIVPSSDALSGGISLNIEPICPLSGTLESPSINLTGYTYATLSFWTWWEIEGKNPATRRSEGKNTDAMAIHIKKESDSNWFSLGYLNPFEDPSSIYQSGEAYTSGGYNQPGIWVKHNLDISGYVGQNIKIRFNFNTGDRLWNGFRGWFLDDIKISNQRYSEISGLNKLKQFFPPSRN